MKEANTIFSNGIESRKDNLALEIVDEQWRRNPGFVGRYGESGRSKCIRDVAYNLTYISQAIGADSPKLLETYIEWVKALFKGLNIPTEELRESIEITGECLKQNFGPDVGPMVDKFVGTGLKSLAEAPDSIPSFFDDADPLSSFACEYLEKLRKEDRFSACKMVLDAVDKGMTVKDLYMHVFQPSQYEIGRLWQMNQMTVAEEHYCTAATQLVMAQLYPKIFSSKKNGHKMIAICVGNELHEIGLHMVADLFEIDGWDSYYLGLNTPISSVLSSIAERDADLLAISATMTFHVPLVSELIREIRGTESGKRVAILVGGYPFNIDQELWRHIGADGYAADAENAIRIGNNMMKNAR